GGGRRFSLMGRRLCCLWRGGLRRISPSCRSYCARRVQSAGALSFLPAASKLFSAISWVFASESQVLARTSHAHLFWLSSPRFTLRRHSLASMRLSLLWDIAAMMIPKAYLFLSDCFSPARRFPPPLVCRGIGPG